MIRLGLTGSIAMGKTTVADMFRQRGIPVHDADAAVHQLIEAGGKAVAPVLEAFPAVADASGGIDRGKLAAEIFGNDDKRKRLEGILHPMVRRSREIWTEQMAQEGKRLVVYDIPLLYETGSDKECDCMVVVSAPAWLQRLRAMERPGMTDEKLNRIKAAQIPDDEKCRRADTIIPTGYGKTVSAWYVDRIIRDMLP